jgi:hypothetical protein
MIGVAATPEPKSSWAGFALLECHVAITPMYLTLKLRRHDIISSTPRVDHRIFLQEKLEKIPWIFEIRDACRFHIGKCFFLSETTTTSACHGSGVECRGKNDYQIAVTFIALCCDVQAMDQPIGDRDRN